MIGLQKAVQPKQIVFPTGDQGRTPFGDLVEGRSLLLE
jgi:hypothetical protein